MKLTKEFRIVTMVTLAEIFLTVCSNAQQPLLQITSPVTNSIATEGQTINIIVSADPSVQNVGVIVQNPLPEPQAGPSSSQFTLTLPLTIPAGLYNLTAIGTNASGDVESAPVAIDVEPHFFPASITAGPVLLTLNAVGDKFPIRVMGNFSDGATLDVTHSTRMTYTSNNTQVATVSGSGMITAVGPGQTAIIVQSGQSAGGGVLVTVPQQPSSGTPPVLTSVTPTSGIPNMTQVTVTGSGFGATQGNGFLQLGSQNGVVSSWSDTQIVATVPALSRSGVASVSQNGLYSNSVTFTISAPVIQGISPLSVTAGTQLTITGSGFGAIQGDGLVVMGPESTGVVSNWSDTQITVTVPATGLQPGSLSVRHSSIWSNAVAYAVAPPVITALSSTTLYPGLQLTITGTGFGATKDDGVVDIGPQSTGIVTSWSDTQIVVTVPSAGMQPGNVQVRQYWVWSNGITYTVRPPVITSLSSTTLYPGLQLTITGTGFGATKDDGVVDIGPESTGIVTSWSDTQIVVTVPSAGMQSGDVQVRQYWVWSNGAAYSVRAPAITSLSSTTLYPGLQLTISGSGFGATRDDGVVEIGPESTGIVTSWSDSQIVVTVPSDDLQSGNVRVRQYWTWSNGVAFTVP